MPLAQYGQTSPAGLDPWPIESTLAPLAAAGSSANAQLMLSDYQYQRDAANNLYGQDMQQQHEFAKKQLQQQLYEANLKGLAEAKDPGVLEIMANAPGYAGVFGGAGSAAISDALGRAQAEQGAKTFQAGATGYNQAAQGGLQLNPQQTPGVAGINGTVTAPALVRAAEIRAAATRAAGSADKDKTTISTQVAGTGAGDTHTISRRVPTRDVPQALADADALNQQIRDRRAGVTPLQPAPTQPGTATTAQPAGPVRLDTSSPKGLKAHNDAMKTVDEWSKSSSPGLRAAAADVQAGMQGTAIQTYQMPNGKTIMRGKTKVYPLGS